MKNFGDNELFYYNIFVFVPVLKYFSLTYVLKCFQNRGIKIGQYI